jgi:hypothetical protein
MKSEALTDVAWRMTPDRVRAEAMGFQLSEAVVTWADDALVLHGQMRCVCGRHETFAFRILIDPATLDPARLLRERGAFSQEHLVADGYTPDQVAEILQRGAAHDLACT